MLFVCHPKSLHKHCLQFLLGVKIAPRETENNAYAKFWGDKQRALWYVMVFSGVVNYWCQLGVARLSMRLRVSHDTFFKMPDNTVIDSDSSWEERADEGPINPTAETKRLGANLSLSPKKTKIAWERKL